MRVGYTNKCAIINAAGYRKDTVWPTTKEAVIAIFPSHVKQLDINGDGWRNWVKVNKCIIKSYKSEADVQYIVDAVKEVLDNHQVSGNWHHWWDDEKNNSDWRTFRIEGNIYSYEEETY